MPVFTRYISFPVTFTAASDADADRDATDHAVAAIEHIEARDATGSLTIGALTVTEAREDATGSRCAGHGHEGDLPCPQCYPHGLPALTEKALLAAARELAAHQPPTRSDLADRLRALHDVPGGALGVLADALNAWGEHAVSETFPDGDLIDIWLRRAASQLGFVTESLDHARLATGYYRADAATNGAAR